MKTLLRLSVVAVAAWACERAPKATSEDPSATSTSAATGAPATASKSGAASADCGRLRKAVVKEADKSARCETNADCAVHRIVLCNFDELDCYAAHVNRSQDTDDLDRAISAYTKSCELARCKCRVPEKSVCKSGKCAPE